MVTRVHHNIHSMASTDKYLVHLQDSLLRIPNMEDILRGRAVILVRRNKVGHMGLSNMDHQHMEASKGDIPHSNPRRASTLPSCPRMPTRVRLYHMGHTRMGVTHNISRLMIGLCL